MPIATNLPSLPSPFHPLFASSDRAFSFIKLVNCRTNPNIRKELLHLNNKNFKIKFDLFKCSIMVVIDGTSAKHACLNIIDQPEMSSVPVLPTLEMSHFLPLSQSQHKIMHHVPIISTLF